MSLQFDIEVLLTEVQSRLGIGLSSGQAAIDGGVYQILRPSDLEVGHGFFVALARTPRQFVASVHFDPYAGRLFRLMSEADRESQSAMHNLVQHAHDLGLAAHCVIEVADIASGTRPSGAWKSLEIEVSARTPQGLGDSMLQSLAVRTTCYAFALPLCLVQLEETSSSSMDGYPEGAVTKIEVNRYERNPANRAACLAFHGTRCMGCGLDFGDRYGEIAKGFIEVHHVIPVSKMGGSYVLNPLTDLVPLCSNCHSVVHRVDPPMMVDDLRKLLGNVAGIVAAARDS